LHSLRWHCIHAPPLSQPIASDGERERGCSWADCHGWRRFQRNSQRALLMTPAAINRSISAIRLREQEMKTKQNKKGSAIGISVG
jgi:hypothetical protein